MQRVTDARRLNFSLPSVAAIVIGAIGIVGSQYVLVSSVTTKQTEQSSALRLEQAKIQSDVRDILTRMEAEAKIRELQRLTADAGVKQMSDTITDLKRQMELLRLQYDEMRRR